MPKKPPIGVRPTVDVHTHPSRAADVETAHPGTPGRTSPEQGFYLDNLPPRAGTSGATDANAILPPAVVVVHDVPVEIRTSAPQQSLDKYITNGRAIRSHVNDEGFRVINGRTYADLSDEGMVFVGVDPVTGLYRARLPSELRPSGPVLLRDTASGLWYPREVVEPTTRAQVKKYLAQATDEDADAFIARFADKAVAELELKRIQLGLPQMDSEHISIPHHENHVVQSHEISDAFGMWSTLRRVYNWQGEPDQRVYSDGRLSGFKLDINLTLWPVDKLLSLKFSSVVSLTLRGYAPLNPEVFFAQFPNIESLTVTSQLITRRTYSSPMYASDYSRFSVDSRFAEQLKRLPHLRELSLQDCEFKADFSLRGLTRLQVLRLCNTQEVSVNDLYLQMLHQQQVDILQVAVDVTGMTQLRVLDLTNIGIHLLPSGVDASDVASKLEVVRLGGNPLSISPPLKTMTAVQELDLSSSRLDRFPEGITAEIPRKVLNLANNRIASIPESVELRAGFNLAGNPITDPVSLRRLIAARRETGIDIWLDGVSADQGINHWMHNVPEAQRPEKIALWEALAVQENSTMLEHIRNLVRTPEFQVERQILQRRVWSFLEFFQKTSLVEQSRLRDMAAAETSPGKMLERLEEEINKSDPQWQNQPFHHLPKRPRFE